MKDEWKLVQKGAVILALLGTITGWVVSATVTKAKNEAAREYMMEELKEIKAEIKEVKATGKDTNNKVNENTDNITRATAILELIVE